jgi:glycosyltransferase involved in cell wall biosynthesis
MTIWYVPQEPVPGRFYAQMMRWTESALQQAGEDYRIILPDDVPDVSIKRGQVMDAYRTCVWKSAQNRLIAEAFDQGQIRNGDKVLFGDLWHPGGPDSVAYMSELTNVDIEIWGWHYAGRADPHDFVQKLGDWADDAERSWLKLARGVFLGSQFHADLLTSKFGYLANLHPIGLVWDYWDVRNSITQIRPANTRAKRVIFPHRGAPEKDPDAFYELANRLDGNGYDFVITSSREGTPEELGFRTGDGHPWRVVTGLSKKDYYSLLADSRVFFSSAYQETFGYALQEAIVFGTTPVCPKRLCYPDILQNDERYLYRDPLDAAALVKGYLEYPEPAPAEYSLRYHNSARTAIDIMLGKRGEHGD